ncbi:hypothetical protein PT2222_80049 [Paraburkholderia tropica]
MGAWVLNESAVMKWPTLIDRLSAIYAPGSSGTLCVTIAATVMLHLQIPDHLPTELFIGLYWTSPEWLSRISFQVPRCTPVKQDLNRQNGTRFTFRNRSSYLTGGASYA